MNRNEFRKGVLERDDNKCVICKNSISIVAHHIVDRSLFEDGGYYLNNGVSLCEEHHLEAEQGTLSCRELRIKANIEEVVLPQGFDSSRDYDHWGNIILLNCIIIQRPL